MVLEAVKTVLKGMVVGVANIIPGVSGGTMAVIFKIYDRLVSCTKIKNLKKNWLFLLEIILGAGVGIILFSKGITYLLSNFAMATQLVFVGLILGSIPMIFRNAYSYCLSDGNRKKIPIAGIAAFIAMLVIMILIAVFNDDVRNMNSNIITSLDPLNTVWLAVAGFISAFAMILPGISGSFVILVLGTYMTAITAINDMNIIVLIPIAIGCASGLLAGLNSVRIMLEKAPAITYFAILGLVVGSIFTVFPIGILSFNMELLAGVLLMIAAAVIAYVFSNPKEEKLNTEKK